MLMTPEGDMPEEFDPMKPETWVKEDPNQPGTSVTIAMLGEVATAKEAQLFILKMPFSIK